MKYFIAILAGLFMLGCVSSSQSTQKSSAKSSKANKNAIVDEEFDLLVAPEYDYETDIPYAEQIKFSTKTTGDSSNTQEKPSKKPSATKVN